MLLNWCSHAHRKWAWPGSLEAGGERPALVEVGELDGEALEGVSLRHRPVDRLLELLVARGDAGASLQLVGGEGRGEEVGETVLPHCRQLQRLGGGGGGGTNTHTRNSKRHLSSQLET